MDVGCDDTKRWRSGSLVYTVASAGSVAQGVYASLHFEKDIWCNNISQYVEPVAFAQPGIIVTYARTSGQMLEVALGRARV